MRYALIKDGVVDNVIVADDAFIATLQGYDHIEALDTPEEQKVSGPGWRYDQETNQFTPPPAAPEPEAMAQPRTLTRFAFRSRFTNAEKVAIYQAAESNIEIRVFLDDIMAAEEIDLDLDDTVAGVRALEAAGILAQGRAEEILA